VKLTGEGGNGAAAAAAVVEEEGDFHPLGLFFEAILVYNCGSHTDTHTMRPVKFECTKLCFYPYFPETH
jgi:hypothetical protein